jgi:ribosomal subunit interface protein
MKTTTVQKIKGVKVSFTHLPTSKNLRKYIQKKMFRKLQNVSGDVQSVVFNLSKKSIKGSKKYAITLEVHLRGLGFAIRCQGNNLYNLINEVSDKFHNRLFKSLEKQTDHQHASHEEIYTEKFSKELAIEAEKIERINFYSNFWQQNLKY